MRKEIKRVIIDFTNSAVAVYKELASRTIPIVKTLEKNEGNVIVVNGCAAMLGFEGRFNGRFLLNLSFPEALRLHEAITGKVVNEISDDVLLTVSEVGNMIAKDAVTRINDEFEGANVRLSPPSVFAGKDMKLFNFRINAYNVLLKTYDEYIRINVAVKGIEER